MTSLLFYLFAAICLGLLLQVVVKPRLLYEFPYFMAAAFSGFILPQAYGLFVGQWAPDDWLRDLLLMCSLCLGGCWLGYQIRFRRRWLPMSFVRIRPDRFAIAGVLLTAMGYFFDFLIGRLPPEAKGSQWTGIVTIYLFFANQVFTGFAMCLYCALVYGKRLHWVFAAVGGITILTAVIVYGRREPAGLLVLTVALTLFFARKIVPPRSAIVAGLIGATLLIPATERYRQGAATGERLEALKDIEWGKLLESYSEQSTISELKNAMFMIAVTERSSAYGLGRHFWNRVVFAFVPAQIVGKELKDSLMIQNPKGEILDLVSVEGYELPVGSTVTCVGDLFYQFGFFGGLFLATAGMLFRELFTVASVQDTPLVRVFYIQAMVGAMRSVSHGAGELAPALVYNLIFLGAVAIYARQPTSAQVNHGSVHPVAGK